MPDNITEVVGTTAAHPPAAASTAWRVRASQGTETKWAWDVTCLRFFSHGKVCVPDAPLHSACVSDADKGGIAGYEPDRAVMPNRPGCWGGRPVSYDEKDWESNLWLGGRFEQPIAITGCEIEQGDLHKASAGVVLERLDEATESWLPAGVVEVASANDVEAKEPRLADADARAADARALALDVREDWDSFESGDICCGPGSYYLDDASITERREDVTTLAGARELVARINAAERANPVVMFQLTNPWGGPGEQPQHLVIHRRKFLEQNLDACTGRSIREFAKAASAFADGRRWGSPMFFAAPSLARGQLRSRNYPRHRWRVVDFETVRIDDGSDATTVRLVPGIYQRGDERRAHNWNAALFEQRGASGMVSFALGDGRYLRHCSYNLRAHRDDDSALFRLDATFYLERDRFFPGSVAFRSVNFDDHYISHRSYVLKIAVADDSELHRNDASFAIDDDDDEAEHPPDMRISVRLLSGQTVPLDVAARDRVSAVKRKIEAEVDIRAHQQVLSKPGEPSALPDGATLASCGVEDGGLVHLVVDANAQAPVVPGAASGAARGGAARCCATM